MMQIAPSTDCMFCMQAGHEKNVQQPPDYPSGPLGLEKSGGLTSILIWTRHGAVAALLSHLVSRIESR
jgi:hypothetical protein